ncbi:unnamed protein product [Rhizophagus irregularis]|nr:unnamed protein product [Rhizophagus irregularis]
MSLQCKICGNEYTNKAFKWCKPCQINYLKRNFINWTSGNENIDEFIKEMQFKINSYYDIIFEWIPYSHFNNIKEISRDDYITIYSAIWYNSPLYYDEHKIGYTRYQFCRYKNVNLKCLDNLQITTNEFLNKVNAYSIKRQDNIRKIYGISQNPNTKDYIMVLEVNSIYCEKCNKKYTDISHKWCKPCQLNYFKSTNFTNWTSGNKKIDQFIQNMQLKIDAYDDIVFEWIPYNQFSNIKKISNDDALYLAIWKDGLLCYDEKINNQENQNKNIALKRLCNPQYIGYYMKLSKVNAYSIKRRDDIRKIYGISQNPHTKDYVMVLEDSYCSKCDEKYTDTSYKWCKPCQLNYFKSNFTNWTSGSKIIDQRIQEMQLKIDSFDDIVFEWIPYNQFDNIKEIYEYGYITIYSAIWEYGTLCYDGDETEYTRKQFNKDKNVTLKLFRNPQTDKFLDQVNAYSIKRRDDILKIYGISQNPHTKDYIMVLEVNSEYCEKCDKKYTDIFHKWCKPCQINYLKSNFTNWTSGSKIIDQRIQEMQLKIDSFDDIVFEWIPYNQFDNIKEICEYEYITIYSAIWKYGSLYYDSDRTEYTKKQFDKNKNVTLKLFCNSQADKFSLKVNANSIKRRDDILKIYGISQNPHTKDYIVVLEVNSKYCEKCDKKYTDMSHKWVKSCQINYLKRNFTNWTSGNESINKFIQMIQLKTDYCNGIVFEWVPYDQFNDITEMVDNHAKVYSAVWKDGPLYYYDNIKEWTKKRNTSTKVILKYLHNSQEINNEFSNEYNTLYGISQDPNTKDYIVIQAENYTIE